MRLILRIERLEAPVYRRGLRISVEVRRVVVKCWVEIRYDWGDDGLTLGKTEDPALLARVKEALIAEARQRLAISRQIDGVVALQDQAEVRRLETVLAEAVPNRG